MISGPLSRNIEDYPEGIILPIDKPYRWTSADVVGKIKWAACRHFGKKSLKVGHAGTLDPLATGLLLVCIGPATRKAEELQRSAKQYVAGVSFGSVTASYDLEKELEGAFDISGLTADEVRKVLPQFAGEQMQIAPLFSAKSVDGVRAYEMARKLYRQGAPVEDSNILQANPIHIYSIELEDFCDGVPPVVQPDTPGLFPNPRIHVASTSGTALKTAFIRIECSKGTYIRALARDLGEATCGGAFLSSLRRTSNGGFGIEDAIPLSDALALFNTSID